MAWDADRIYPWNGNVYVPFHSIRLAAGPFYAMEMDCIRQYLELPANAAMGIRDHLVGSSLIGRRRIAGAQVHGDSMLDMNVFNKDFVLFQRWDFPDLRNNIVGVVEKVGDEEGLGAWALKKIVIERRTPSLKKDGKKDGPPEIDWDEPVITLNSYNLGVRPNRLDPSGQYRLHGLFLRCFRPYDVKLVDADWIRRVVVGNRDT